MNLNLYNTTNYERKRDWTLGQNKPNSNPFKANLKRAQMNVNLTLTKDYRKKMISQSKKQSQTNPICILALIAGFIYTLLASRH